MKTIDLLKSQGKLLALWDFRKGSLLDQSGKGNDLVAAGSGGGFGIGPKGYLVRNPATRYFTVADSANNRLSGKGTVLLFGDFTKANAGQVFLAKRDGGGCNYQLATGSGTFELYDGATSSIATSIVGSKMLGFTLAQAGTKPNFFKDGAYIGDGSASSTLPSGSQVLYIGQYGGGYNRNGMYAAAIFNDALTPQQISQIYEEFMAERGTFPVATTNFISPIQDDITGKCILHWDMSTKTGDGKMLDRTGNGRHGVLSKAVSAPGLFDRGTYVNGDNDSYVSLTNGLALFSNTDSYGISIWINPETLAGGNILFGTTNFYFLFTATSITWQCGATAANFGTTITPTPGVWQHVYIEKTGDTTGNIYINNVQMTLTSGSLSATPSLSTDLLLGNYAVGGYGFASVLDNFKVFNAPLTSVERIKEYLEGARLLRTKHIDSNIPVTLVNVAADGYIPFTNWSWVSGTWKVSEDSLGKRWIENVFAGIVATKSKKAYGTWVFDVYHSEDSRTDICFVASVPKTRADASQSAYTFEIIPSERIQLEKNLLGTPSDLAYTAPAYIAAGTYKVAVTRKTNGSFSVYIKGGTFTNWTLVSMAGGGGSNPVTDTAITTSNYILLDMYAGDKIGNFYTIEGVIDPTVNPELIPN